VIRIMLVLFACLCCSCFAGRLNNFQEVAVGEMSGMDNAKPLVWTSPAGKECLGLCVKRVKLCFKNARSEFGADRCRSGLTLCVSRCPDVREPRCAEEFRIPASSNCWQAGICGRGECELRQGCCVKK